MPRPAVPLTWGAFPQHDLRYQPRRRQKHQYRCTRSVLERAQAFQIGVYKKQNEKKTNVSWPNLVVELGRNLGTDLLGNYRLTKNS